MKPLIMIGSGGFARECLWLLKQINQQQSQWDLKGLVAPDAPDWSSEFPYLGDDTQVIQTLGREHQFIIAIGGPKIRKELSNKFEAAGFQAASLIHPAFQSAASVQIGAGSIICAGVQTTVNIEIGKHCIINLNTSIGHEAQIGDFCTLSPGTNISGAVKIGQSCFLGSGVNVLPGRKISPHITIGAGAVVTNHLQATGVYVGVPAKQIKN
ncbi:MAG: acetyltransferase [Bacteroidota bacterium]